jgi:fructose-bisphosphate aldolase class I
MGTVAPAVACPTMKTAVSVQNLVHVAGAMVVDGKGLLAMDESNGTCNQRLAAAGIEQTVATRRAYRELLLGTPSLGECISGVILYDETLHQSRADGTPFVQGLADAGILIGIKVDIGTQELAGHPGEKVTEGLDGLRERLQAYAGMGARFAKWRAVIRIGPEGSGLPSRGCIDVNMHALARYAALCQQAGLVPIVEPEVLMDGAHTQERCAEVTQAVLRQLFKQLVRQRVALEALILKPNMVLAGLACPTQHSAAEVAAATLRSLLRVVPAAVPGITFLSGGQTGEQATARLAALHRHDSSPAGAPPRALPWRLSFSFARALQHPALEIWAGQDDHRASAQRALLYRARCNSAALRGLSHIDPAYA